MIIGKKKQAKFDLFIKVDKYSLAIVYIAVRFKYDFVTLFLLYEHFSKHVFLFFHLTLGINKMPTEKHLMKALEFGERLNDWLLASKSLQEFSCKSKTESKILSLLKTMKYNCSAHYFGFNSEEEYE